jgi:steroid 5-alpha reductase family enzyme
MSLNLFLQVLALVSLVLAAVNAPGHPRVNWGWLGMALWMLTIVFGGLKL